MNELPVGSWLVFLAALVAILVSLLIRRTALTGKETGAKLPPGPWNLPIIGSLHHLLGAPPHRALHHLSRRYGPIMLLRVGKVPTIVISSPEAAMEVMKTNDPIFASRPVGATLDIISCGGKSFIFAPYGEYWRQMRKVCVVELLSARQVRRMERIRQDEVARLVGSIAAMTAASPATAVVDLSQRLTELTNNIVGRAVFGGKCRQQQEYLRELGVMTTLAGGFSLPDLFPSSRLIRWLSGAMRDLRRSHARVHHIIGDIIQERKEKQSSSAVVEDDDLLDVLLQLQEEDSLVFPLTAEIIGTIVSVSYLKH